MSKRVAFVDHYDGSHLGGGEEYLLLVATGVRERGFDPVVVCVPGGVLARAARERGLPVCEVSFGPRSFPAGIRRLERCLTDLAPDVVNAHGYWSGVAVRAALRSARSCAVVVTVHSEVLPSERGVRRAVRAVRNLIERAMSGNTRYVAVSNHLAEQLLRIGLPRERVRVIHPAVSREAAQNLLSIRRRETDDELVFGAAGRLVPVKGFDVLVRAFDKVRAHDPRARLVVYGEGPQRKALTSLASSLGLGATVDFPGFAPRDRVYSSVDVLVNPSFSEGFSLVLAEAGLAGLPVVCTSAGAQGEIVEDEVTGIIVPPGDVDALAAAMIRLARDPSLRARLGDAAREAVAARFSEDRLVEQHVQLFSELVGRVQRGRNRPREE